MQTEKCEDDNSNCPEGQTCDNGTCRGGSCENDPDCPGNCQKCNGSGECEDDDSKCTGCESCVGGNCKDDNANCGENQRCVDGECCNRPMLFTVWIRYKTGDDVRRGYVVLIPSESYDNEQTCWCDHYTLCRHRKRYKHSHNLGGFPVEAQRDDGSGIWDTVTDTMVKAYYDEWYYDQGLTPVEGEGPTFSMNCHGYATGKNFWIDDVGTVLDHEYAECSNGEATLAGGGSHTIKVETVHPDGTIKRNTEKWGVSGIYEFEDTVAPGRAMVGTAYKKAQICTQED